MRYEYKSSFDRSFRRLASRRRAGAAQPVEAIIDFFESGKRAPGLGLKQLRKPFWEVRSSIRDRAIFAVDDDAVRFVIIGSHDEIKRFLKKI